VDLWSASADEFYGEFLMVETSWREGRLNSGTEHPRLVFGRMYEDAGLELEAFRGRRQIFCIASAGSTAFALSQEREVVACDINPVQLEYAKWRAKGGSFRRGDADRAMGAARALAPAVGWRRDVVRRFLSFSHVEEQMEFWRSHLDNRRFRLGLDALMSKSVLRLVYSSGLLSCLPPRFGQVLKRRLERGFAKHPNATNPYAWALLLGETLYPDERQKEQNIEFVAADAASYLESCERKFDAFTFSNILDGASPAYAQRLERAVRHAAAPGAVVVLRSFREPESDCADNRAENERSLIWGSVQVGGPQILSS
jgi:S-adenosylmethionine:diacylglycerol 3-amino-3-carboxypropyl transferase